MTKYESVVSSFNHSFTLTTKSQNSQVPAVNTITNDTYMSNSSSNNSPKMGSRRIFTPQFKLQVLESYRNDSDCKGNQRATARKYNIHRRQIQKWLQCESSLRSSVANINQNSVKQHFHNISHQQKLHVTVMAPTKNSASSYGNQQQRNQSLCLDAARHIGALNSMKVSSSVSGTSSISSTQGMLSAVVAAATDVVTIANTATSTVSPLRPAAIGCNSTMQPIQHQLHQYPMPYPHTSAIASVSVPFLTHHMPPQHIHHYQYQNMSQRSQVTQPLAFLSSACLPIVSEIKVANTQEAADDGKGTITRGNNKAICELETSADLPTNTTITTTIGNNYIYGKQYVYNYYENERDCESILKDHYKVYQIQQAQALSTTPMDLSLRARREIANNNYSVPIEKNELLDGSDDHLHPKNLNPVVDLTFRKRKVDIKQNQSEKLAKHIDGKIITEKDIAVNFYEVNVDVEKKTVPSKPIKLFKPYLLDEENNIQMKSNNAVSCESESRQHDPIIWSHHPACMSPNSYDSRQDSSTGSTFQSPPLEIFTFPTRSQNFPANKSATNALRLECEAKLFPTIMRCPKGSPVSGYESSSSTYSDSSCGGESKFNTFSRAYSIDLKLRSIYDKHILNNSHVLNWLGHDIKPTPHLEDSSISLYS